MLLTRKQLERGRALGRDEATAAEHTRRRRWAWGDWACDIAPMNSEYHDGSRARLAAALDELSQSVEDSESLPMPKSLAEYRIAAAAIPPLLRDHVRSIEVGRVLAAEVEDKAERVALVERLAAEHPKGIVTVDAIRAHFDRATTNTGKAHKPTLDDIIAQLAELDSAALDQIADRATAIAIERLEAVRAERRTDATAGELLEGDDFDPSESWADKLLIRVDKNARLLTRQVERWGLVLGALSVDEALEHVEEAEQQLAEVRAALQERVRDGVAR